MIRHLLPTAAVSLFLVAAPAGAAEVGLAGILGSKAMLVINGGSPRTVAVGEVTREGVKLISAQGETAVVEVDGRRLTLRVGVQSISTSKPKEVTLFATENNHFVTHGSINGFTMQFLVDTGASSVSISRADAVRLGIDLKQGRRGITNTANGVIATTVIKLDRVTIGEITLHSVEATVIDTNMPFALLGMSFLSRTDIQYEGKKMILKQRF